MNKRLLAILLVCLLVITATACNQNATSGTTTQGTTTKATDATTTQATEPASEYPEYLNLESDKPVIKDGEGQDVVLKVAIVQPANGGEWDDLWISKYYKQYMNVNLDVEQILDTAVPERKNLMFASGDLPDLLLNLSLTPSEIVKYGQMEGQLLRIDEHVSDGLTPNIMKLFNERPDAKALVTTPDGHIYTLPYVAEKNNEGSIPRLFINESWLEQCGLAIPKTLDEFVTMARTFKEKDPGGVGQDKVIPIGGSEKYQSLGYYVLNAMGYVGGVAPLSSPRIRNGEVDIPCGNPELFREYLTLMNTFYQEGLISKDFFVIDRTEVIAQLVAGQIGVYGVPVYVTGIDTWTDWVAAVPLTSQWNSTQVWAGSAGISVGGFAISAKSELKELGLRFANAYYGEDSRVLWVGPVDGAEDAMGYLGQTRNQIQGDFWDETKYPDGITDLWSYLMAYIGPYPSFGNFDTPEAGYYYQLNRKENKNATMDKVFELTNPDQHYRATVYENLWPHVTEAFPATYYLDEDSNIRLADLTAVIEPYVKEQSALFISGERPLSEFDNYINELKTIGFDEYLEIYKQVWTNYQNAMK